MPLLLTLIGLATFLITLACFPPFIALLQRLAFGQTIREDGPATHQKKQGTPTGGGVLLLLVLAILWLLAWSLASLTQHTDVLQLLQAPALLWSLLVTLALGALGVWDDALKIFKKHNKGLGGYAKLAVQTAIGVALGVAQVTLLHDTSVNVFGTMVDIGWWHVVFTAFVVVASSNAVNLTDGLDGLAGGGLVASFVGCFLYCLTLMLVSGGMPIFQQAQAGVLLCLMVLGGLLAFLVFNHHPAKIFMGDSGSLALGGTLAALMLVCNLDSWYLFCGMLYVMEAFSVVLQVGSFKLTGKRLFKMAPIHHHFELLGWSEQRVVRTFVYSQAGLMLLGAWLFWAGF
ncbi:MAG: phospho-N-acetylmuramoyl-pentapeptide-transferase [Vampirovibrionales bacterium]